MKKAAASIFGTFAFSLLLLNSPSSTSAYTDYSIHRIETGDFIGEENVKSSLQRLIDDTGWWATYKSSGNQIPYYQVNSGGFYGEDNVKEVLNLFQTTTGLQAEYQAKGDQEPYRKIVSGKYYGKANAEQILQQFQNETGVTGAIEPAGTGTQYKKRIVTGGFYGEQNVKNVLQDFQSQTGITATYENTGAAQDYYRIVTGGFRGEENVKQVINEFATVTGMKASYEPTQYIEYYSIETGGFYGEANVQSVVTNLNNATGLSAYFEPTNQSGFFKVKIDSLSGDSLNNATNYLDESGFWYKKVATGKKVPVMFRIVSEEMLDKDKLNVAIKFFSDRNWWATISKSGNKAYNYFRLVTNPFEDQASMDKGLNYFKTRGWWVTTQQTSEKITVYFNIVSEPLLDKNKVNKGVNFFKSNNWWVTTNETDKKGYTTFYIKSNPILGESDRDKALNFFKSHKWWASSNPTGKSEGVFKIVTGGFQGYENTLANANMIKERYGWSTTVVNQKKGPQVTTTDYGMTLEQMLDKQMQNSPQTDKYKNDPAYVYAAYIDVAKNVVTEEGLNVRKGPGTNFESVRKLEKGFKEFTILGKEGDWYKIALTWKNAKPEDVLYYLNPGNISSTSDQYYQFLKLSETAGINIDEVNEKILNDKAGTLKGTAAVFAQAAQQYGVNELYLIAHAIHETGYGTSKLATGVQYNGKTVYNMYGYNAFDGCAVDCGAKKAYDEGWFSPELAIIGGAKLIGAGYIYNDTFQQDTLYKMRWNPVQTWHQYATDIGWASKQVTNLYNYYQMLDNYTLYIDKPVYLTK